MTTLREYLTSKPDALIHYEDGDAVFTASNLAKCLSTAVLDEQITIHNRAPAAEVISYPLDGILVMFVAHLDGYAPIHGTRDLCLRFMHHEVA